MQLQPMTPLVRPAASASPRWRRGAKALLVASLAAWLTACGGGGGGVGTGGTGAFAIGSINGFGSVIVNGVRFDDSAASVFDDDGSARSGSDLQLGMVVEVRGSLSDDGLSGRASSFSYHAQLKGPVTAVGADTLTVFGQTVRVTAATVFSGVGGLGGIAVGHVVEVYGLPDAGGAITATRIEWEATSVGVYSGEFRVRGTVSGLSGTPPTLRFTVGTVTVTTDASTTVSGTVANAAFVSVRLAKTAAGDGSYAATRVQVKSRNFDDDIAEAEVEGLVSDFVGVASPFKVNGYPVRLGASVTYEDGALGDLVNGVRVEVKGKVVAGVLVAGKVEFEDEDAGGGGDGSKAPFEFKGVAACSPAPCASGSGSFTVTTSSGRAVEIRYDASTRFDNGVTTANLNGFDVEVKAVAGTGATAGTFLATRIEPND